jgi:hypothetical protein
VSYQNAECTGSGGAASVASDRCCGWHLCARDHSSPFEPNRWICVPTQQKVCTDNFVFSTQNGRLVAHAHLLHPICSVHPRASCSLHCSASTTTQTMSSQQTTYLHLFRTPFIGFFLSLTGPTPGKWNLQRWMMRRLIQLVVRRDRMPQATLGPRTPQSTRELCTDSLHLIF